MEISDGGDLAAAGGESTAKPCDYCSSADAVVYCCKHSAFMCLSCDVRIHFADTGARHGRVWICEVCEQEPAAVTCKADAAALCVACDRDIHSANHVARKHERYPMVQFFGSAEAEAAKLEASTALFADDEQSVFNMDILETKLDSWPPADGTPEPATGDLDLKLIDFLFSEADQSTDFHNFQLPYDSIDSVIPIESTTLLEEEEEAAASSHIHAPEASFHIDFSKTNYGCHSQSACSSFTSTTLSQSVSSSSAGVITGGSSSEVSHPFPATGNISSVNAQGKQPHIVPNDRVARVLRYQEKRRNRNFKKTVRYASRKAYAETRPRVKGRFMKRGGDAEHHPAAAKQ